MKEHFLRYAEVAYFISITEVSFAKTFLHFFLLKMTANKYCAGFYVLGSTILKEL